MIDTLNLIFKRLMNDVGTERYRFLYDTFSIKNRLTGLIGARGVGKTTLMLQYIKNNLLKSHRVFYFSADHIYFNSTSIYAFIENLFLTEGITVFLSMKFIGIRIGLRS